MTYALTTINPFYAARLKRRTMPTQQAPTVPPAKQVVRIGPATLYHGDCFQVLPGSPIHTLSSLPATRQTPD